MEIVGLGQPVGQSLGCGPVFNLQVLNLAADYIVRNQLEVLVTEKGYLNKIGWVDWKAGLKFSGSQCDGSLGK